MMKGDLLKGLEAKSDALTTDDLAALDKVIKITCVEVDYGADRPWSIFFEGDNGKPYKPSKGMRVALAFGWQTDNSEDFVGRSIKLYLDKEVKFGADVTGGVRISHMSDIDMPFQINLTVRRNSRKKHTIQPLREYVTVNTAPEFTQADGSALLGASNSLPELQQVWQDPRMTGAIKNALKPMLDALKEEFTGDNNYD